MTVNRPRLNAISSRKLSCAGSVAETDCAPSATESGRFRAVEDVRTVITFPVAMPCRDKLIVPDP